MSELIKICTARQPHIMRIGAHENYVWPAGSRIRVKFMDGDLALQERVKETAKVWTSYANIEFFFVDDGDADIRVSFKADKGSWSVIGTDVQNPAYEDKITMNFGWLTPASDDVDVSRVVLHEFGHALGCIHEHQSPVAGIKWDKDAVYKYCAGLDPPWSEGEVDQRIFKVYSTAQTSFTAFDPTSIMMYPIPKGLTTDDFEVDWNHELSDMDKTFIRTKYPR